MHVPEYLHIKSAHETLTTMGSATTCCVKQVIKDEQAQRAIDEIREFLGEAYADARLLSRCHLMDAFHMIGLGSSEYRSGCARLARILAEAGKRPLSEHDLDFARRALHHWSALRANLA